MARGETQYVPIKTKQDTNCLALTSILKAFAALVPWRISTANWFILEWRMMLFLLPPGLRPRRATARGRGLSAGSKDPDVLSLAT